MIEASVQQELYNMITIGYSTRKHNPEFQEYLRKTAGYPKINIIEKINNGDKSLTKVYNEILNESLDDIVVFTHDDLTFEKNGWVRRVIDHFNKTDYGIIGVAGTTYMPSSGQWWEDRSKMVGIVNHEHNGKKWESKYSDSLGKEIQQVVVIDGLFFGVHKKRISNPFNEEVKGFHMYDIDFSFQNYLAGVKVGVMFDVRVTHKSIGQTNDQWEVNKNLFSEKYKDLLPQKIKKTKNDRLKILIGCLSLTDMISGPEFFVYDMALNLKNQNHDITICYDKIEKPVSEKLQKLGIKLAHLKEPKGFKMGDGKWSVTTSNGNNVSKEGQLYKIRDMHYDVVHLFSDELIEYFNKLYIAPIVSTRFTDQLFVDSNDNPLIKKSFDISDDQLVPTMDIINTYIEATND